MAKILKKIERIFKGQAVLGKADTLMVRFVAQPIKGVKSMGPIILDPEFLPKDYEQARYSIDATVAVTVRVKELPPEKPKA